LLVIVKSHPLQTAKKALVRGEIIELGCLMYQREKVLMWRSDTTTSATEHTRGGLEVTGSASAPAVEGWKDGRMEGR
jgi:hypothetical protein